MAGRTEYQAVQAFVDPIRRSLAYFTGANLRPSGYKSEAGTLVLVLNDSLPAKLRGRADLALELNQWFEIVPAEGERGPFKTSTTGYAYALRTFEEDREIVAYHWHPTVGARSARLPHIHIAAPGAPGGARAHIPSGRIAIEHVLLLAREYGAQPKPGWQSVVYNSLKKFERWRTWA